MLVTSKGRTAPNVSSDFSSRARFLKQIHNYRYVYILIIPGVLYFLTFRIAPLWGLLLAFKDYSPFQGLWGSRWVYFHNFAEFFGSVYFYMMLRNTLVISLLNLVFFFPVPILLAVLLNEVRGERFKRVTQTLVYLPHFLSWVVIAGLTFFIFSVDVGLVNKIAMAAGGEPVSYLTNQGLFWWVILGQNVWKETGWGSILFLASISQIDTGLYDAAIIDGTTRLQRISHITLPSIMPTIIVLLIIRLGHVMDVSFEQILLMSNALVRDVAEVFDTYSYTQGILQGNFSNAVTVGVFKSLTGLCLVLLANRIIKKLGHGGIF
jgi:putative aldouronate transport system permease protein